MIHINYGTSHLKNHYKIAPKKLYTLAPFFVEHLLTRYCQFSSTSVVLETSILLPPPAIFFQNISTPISQHSSELRHNCPQH